jgi:hypothetical protein
VAMKNVLKCIQLDFGMIYNVHQIDHAKFAKEKYKIKHFVMKLYQIVLHKTNQKQENVKYAPLDINWRITCATRKLKTALALVK